MSKAFTKEDDDSAETLPDLPQSSHPNYVTPEGLAALQDRLHKICAKLVELRANKEDIKTHLAVAVAERDIRFVEERIKRAILVDPRTQPPGVIAFGATIEVIDEDGETHIYRIVGEDEADPARGLITPFSPLARALIGAKIGDVVEWERPKGQVELEIATIRFA
jgi:transcription elongation factor GreB